MAGGKGAPLNTPLSSANGLPASNGISSHQHGNNNRVKKHNNNAIVGGLKQQHQIKVVQGPQGPKVCKANDVFIELSLSIS